MLFFLANLKGWKLLLKAVGREYSCSKWALSKLSEIHRPIEYGILRDH